jgi:ankyrin repeat protein
VIDAINNEAGSKTPLYIAVEKDRPDITKIFLELGDNSDKSDNNRKAAKQLAKEKKLTEILKTFREYNHKDDLLKCLKHGDVTAGFQYHLKSNQPNIPVTNSSKNSPIHLAILGGHKAKKSEKEILNLLKKLIEKEANPDLKNHEGRTPLFLAIEKGYLTIIDYLLEDINVEKTVKDNYGNTILHIAARGKDEEVVNKVLTYILNGDINAQNDAGQTPLHNVHQPRIAQILCDMAADATKPDNNNHKPVDYFLIRKERHELLDIVIPLSDLSEEQQRRLRESEQELSSHLGNFALKAAKAVFDITFLVSTIKTTLSLGGSIVSTLMEMLVKKMF